MVDFEKKKESEDDTDFGQPFDYDPTASASLSEQPGVSDAVPSAGSASPSGPGWDTYAGVGNGPGWGDMPSYPPPEGVSPPPPPPGSPGGPTPTESYPLPGYPSESQPTQAYPTAYGHQTGNPLPDRSGGYPTGHYPASPNYPLAQNYPAPNYPVPNYPAPGYPTPNYPAPGYPAQNADPYQGGYGQNYVQPGYPQVGGTQIYFQNSGVDAPFGRDPITGEPLSDKSKVAAGLLQIFLGGFGAGRFYIGSNGIAVAQLLLLILGWLTVIIGVGALILLGLGIWVVIDGIMMLVGSAKDGNGRKLRQ